MNLGQSHLRGKPQIHHLDYLGNDSFTLDFSPEIIPDKMKIPTVAAHLMATPGPFISPHALNDRTKYKNCLN